MLFRKKITRQCAYCQYAAKVDAQWMVCIKKGIVPADGACGRFCYDPLKRVPEPHMSVTAPCMEEGDYSL